MLKYIRSFAKSAWYLSILLFIAGVVASINAILNNSLQFFNTAFSDFSNAVQSGGSVGGASENFSCFLHFMHQLGIDSFLTNVFSTYVGLGVFWGSSILLLLSLKSYVKISSFAGKALLG